jgi:hypothetical protein
MKILKKEAWKQQKQLMSPLPFKLDISGFTSTGVTAPTKHDQSIYSDIKPFNNPLEFKHVG